MFSAQKTKRLIARRFLSLPFFCTASLLGLLLVFSHAQAASSTKMNVGGSPVLMSAEYSLGDQEKETVELVGNVQITFEGQHVRCDRAVVDKKNNMVYAEGNLIITSAQSYVEGTRGQLSLVDNTGVIYDGFVKSGQVLFEGTVIRKLGPVEYEAQEAVYTACTTCPPAWKFSGSRIRAELGGYAFIKNSWFAVGGINVLWLPYLVVPLKSERQTGFLIPNIELSQELAIGIPFFWAISRSQDATIQAKFSQERGVKGLFNYRYVFTEESGGEINAGVVRDPIFARDAQLPSRVGAERSDRWFFTQSQAFELPGGFSNHTQFNFVSDLRYSRDFRDEIYGVGDPALENRVSLTKNTERMHSSVDASYYINQLKSDPIEGNADSVHRFPELRQSGIDRSFLDSRVFFRWDFNYVNFAREDFAYDDVVPATGGSPKRIDRTRSPNSAGSGVFQPGQDQIRTGQRLDLRPEFSLPFRISDYIDVLPSLEFRHTQYSFNVSTPPGSSFDLSPNRQYVRGKLSLRTQLVRIYELSKDNDEIEPLDGSEPSRDPAAEVKNEPAPGIFSTMQPGAFVPRPERLRHEIEPEITLIGIPWMHQMDSPFFGDTAKVPIFLEGQPISDSDFYSTKGVQFDYNDRITQRNAVAFTLNNNFVRKTWSGATPQYKQIISLKNGTSYDIDEANRIPGPGEQTFPYSDIFTILDVRFDNFETNSSVRYYPFHKVANTSSRARLTDSFGNFVQVTFAQNNLITQNISEAYAGRTENLGLGFGFNHRYATITTQFEYLPSSYWPVDLRVRSWSVLANLRPPGNCWGVLLSVTQGIGEGVKFRFNFDYNFGGAIN